MSRRDNWVVGINAVASALEHDVEHVREVLLEAGARNPRLAEIEETARRRDVPVRRVPLQSLEGIAGGLRHQGAIARYEAPRTHDEKDLAGLVEAAEGKALVLALDGVQDPHNLGACLRTADACGALAVVVPRDRAAQVNATVRKVAAGAAETTPVVSVTNLARSLKLLKEAGLWVAGADAAGERLSWEVDLTGPRVIVMGAEGAGLRELTRRHCDFLVRLPQVGTVESLNVSVATGMLLYEVLRQRSMT